MFMRVFLKALILRRKIILQKAISGVNNCIHKREAFTQHYVPQLRVKQNHAKITFSNVS